MKDLEPTDYDVATSRLLYYPERGFEVRTPLADWYEIYQQASPLRCTTWERFHDPDELTYAMYTARQREREAHVDGLLQALESADARRSSEELEAIARAIGPLRFPLHGLQMVAGYVGALAPCGRIASAFALQAADDMRRVHRLAYRLRQLQLVKPELGDMRIAWQRDPAWQPLRELVERLLVTYDWGEALVALDLVVRPVIDELWLVHAGRVIAARGDDVTPRILRSLYDDSSWQRAMTRALIAVAVAEDPTLHKVITSWRDRWWLAAQPAIAAAEHWLPDGAREAVGHALADYWTTLELGAPP